MKTLSVYMYVVFNMIGTLFSKKKYNSMKGKGQIEEAQKLLNKVVKEWAQGILDKAGVTVKAEGLENIPDEACCFIANHQGDFDIVTILATIDKPMGFIAKKEMEKLPIISWWMKQMQCVFMDRQNVREALKSINQGSENMKNGQSMVIFPEGTRSKSSTMGEFKKGSLKMATKAKVPIVPITLDGTYKIFEENNGKIKSGEVKLVVGEPIYIENLSREDQKNISEIVKNRIAKNL
ncbi:acyl-phosphate glycerol 3-phosphate acyltransferase [Clostridium novyi A str. 4570]|uniref:1-acyl-sn-glycerol-3-phosphate acyltransferase n=1 Tax=Clostridium novyi A str. 4570 TaxID=1444290 RepID=A0AA88ZSS8_CLONO|nr:lysophospholipid acyltransferase family protein [Clostridium novyi]KGN02521.1 acyl-phosphate glycerol 3-phosphate acyltransferase [Clostridium novyi A str. 4570]